MKIKFILLIVIISILQSGYCLEYSADLKNGIAKHTTTFRVAIFKNVLKKIQDQVTNHWTIRKGAETGGDLFGAFDENHKIFTIEYATGPGPHATFVGGHYGPDNAFRLLFSNCLNQHPTVTFNFFANIASWHSHHTMTKSFPGPSGSPGSMDIGTFIEDINLAKSNKYLGCIAHIFPPNDVTLNAYLLENITSPDTLNYWHIASTEPAFTRIPCKCPNKTPIPFLAFGDAKSPDFDNLVELENRIISFLTALKTNNTTLLKTELNKPALQNILGSGQSLLHIICRVPQQISDSYLTKTVAAAKELKLLDKTNKNGETPLHIAAGAKYFEAVKALVNAGANVNATNNYGGTALFASVAMGSIDIVTYLLSLPAITPSLTLKTHGKRPLDLVNEILGTVSLDVGQKTNYKPIQSMLEKKMGEAKLAAPPSKKTSTPTDQLVLALTNLKAALSTLSATLKNP